MAGGLAFEIARESMGAAGRYQAEVIDPENTGLLFAARTLSTTTFVNHGKISQEAIDSAGGLAGFLERDPYHDNSIYFACVDTKSKTPEEPIAATRIIVANQSVSNIRLPIDEFSAGSFVYDSLTDQAEGAVGEFGALAKKQGVSKIASLILLREVLGTACERGMVTLVTGLDQTVWQKAYSKQFGGALSRIQNEDVQTRNVAGLQVPLWLHLPSFPENQRAFTERLPRKRDRVAGKLINQFMVNDPRIANYGQTLERQDQDAA